MVNIPRKGTRRIHKGILMSILPLFLIMSGCSCFTVKNDAPCPERPDLLSMPVDLQLRTPDDAKFIMGQNQLALKEYAKKLEVRAGCLQ